MRDINVVFIIDARGLKRCLVSMYSVLLHRDAEDYIHFYLVVDESFTERDMQIPALYLSSEYSSIDIVQTRAQDYTKFSEASGDALPINTLYRLALVNLLPHIQRVIYLDWDVVATGSLWDLYNTNLQDKALAAVADNSAERCITYIREVFGISLHNYYNAGVLLLDLAKFRQDNLYQQMVELVNRVPAKSLRYADQDVLNMIIPDIVYLEDIWNKQTSELTTTLPLSHLVKIYHYKPWNFNVPNPYSSLWWECADKLPFCCELLNGAMQESLTNARKMIASLQRIPRLRRRLIKARWFSYLTFGKLRRHYQQEYQRLQQEITRRQGELLPIG